ncbi:arylsulfatase [Stieleria varia]|uniref:Arylsulfatase n=1 Tax=Stieleria varia TaxID=2528005 RepID=A0A5C6AWK3_9BACT|nr:arylsulfatase [Stieleria varia]TWU04405.1 Arylsulfatase [Stieleria varia]
MIFRSTLSVAFGLLVLAVASAAEKPNIVYIMSDDMGYSDIECYGGEISTPNLNMLADGGIRYTQFYNTGRCCPTRASLLTGLYPHQAGIGHMMEDRGFDGYRGELNRNCVTIAEALKSAGYRAYLSGKWHVTREVRPKTDADKFNWPLQRGFDRFYGTIHGAGSFFDPNTLTRDNQYISPLADPAYTVAHQSNGTFYYTDAIADQACRFIHEHRIQTGDQPFFLYVSFTAAHWPMHALPKDIAKYTGKYDEGYAAVRNARYRRMLELGLITEDSTVNWPIADEWKETEFWEWDKHNMEVYAAMIDSMDQGIGRIVESLQDTDQFDNTLICFFQDNGGCAENYGRGGNGQPRADAPTLPPLADDYLQPDMQPKQSRDGYPVRTGKGVMAGGADTYIGYGRGWATVSNTPFREYKHYNHEGGISTPLIAHWPQRIKRAGELDSTPGHLVDLMATAVDVGGAEYPAVYHDGKPIKPMEGVSLAPTFDGKSIEQRAIYWEHEGNRAIRVGNDKLVAKGANGPWELYDISKDRSEQNDLSSEMPERAEELAQMWHAYAERANVLPLNPGAKKNAADRNAANREQRRFELVGGADLGGESAPYVVGRPLSVEAQVSVDGDGVVVAQGGTAHGWSLHIRDGRPVFCATIAGKRESMVSESLVMGDCKIRVSVGRKGAAKLFVDDKVVAESAIAWPMTSQPIDGLQVGQDSGGNVDDYESPNPLSGKVTKVVIEL